MRVLSVVLMLWMAGCAGVPAGDEGLTGLQPSAGPAGDEVPVEEAPIAIPVSDGGNESRLELPIGPSATGLTSPCDIDGWTLSSADICRRAIALSPLQGIHWAGLPAIARHPNDPDTMAVAVDVMVLVDRASQPPPAPRQAHEWMPIVYLTQDGGATWTDMPVRIGELGFPDRPNDNYNGYHPRPFFDSRGVLHLFVSATSWEFPVLGLDGEATMVHAWQDAGEWSGVRVEVVPGEAGRVMHAWDDGQRMYVVAGGYTIGVQTQVMATPLGHVAWKPIPGWDCPVAVDHRDPYVRVDFQSLPEGQLFCARDRTILAMDGEAFGRHAGVGTLPCDHMWGIPIGVGWFGIAPEDLPGCGDGSVSVAGNLHALTDYLVAPGVDPDSPPTPFGLEGDAAGNAIIAYRSWVSPETARHDMTEFRPNVALVDRDGSLVQHLSLVGDLEYLDDPMAANFFDAGQCGVDVAGAEVLVACAEHDAGTLNLFRLQIVY